MCLSRFGKGISMKRKPVLIAIFTFTGLSCYFLWANSSVREGIEPDSDYATWQPTAEAIQKQLPAGSEHERESAFALLFQKRFRKHEPGKAIGVHFHKDGKVQLLTPARMDPWDIDRIVLMLHQELNANFQKDYPIDIFETFIGARPLKIAEVEKSPRDPHRILVHYNYPQNEETMLALPQQIRPQLSPGRSGQPFRPGQKPIL